MRLLAFLLLTLPVISCAAGTQPSEAGLCLALPPLVDQLATDLQGKGVPDAVLISGARVVAASDAGCSK